jgi:hypothetical protein
MNTRDTKANDTTYATTNKPATKVRERLFGLALAAALLVGTTTPCLARGFAQAHPRRAQLNGRFAQLNTRMSSSYGQLGGHYQNLQGQSNQIQSQMHADAQANGGRLTRAEQGQFNSQYGALGQQVSADQAQGAPSGQWMQNHPRRAQVLNGAAGANQTLSNNYGNLGGHYVGLEQRDNNIRSSAMSQAQANGGYLTQQQQQQLNNRQTNLNNAISQDSGQ